MMPGRLGVARAVRCALDAGCVDSWPGFLACPSRHMVGMNLRLAAQRDADVMAVRVALRTDYPGMYSVLLHESARIRALDRLQPEQTINAGVIYR